MKIKTAIPILLISLFTVACERAETLTAPSGYTWEKQTRPEGTPRVRWVMEGRYAVTRAIVEPIKGGCRADIYPFRENEIVRLYRTCKDAIAGVNEFYLPKDAWR